MKTKVLNYKFDLVSFFQVLFNKYLCPDCDTGLSMKFSSIVVDSESYEARNYDFSFGDEGYFFGLTKFTGTCYFCKNCKRQFSVNEIQVYERVKEKLR